MASYPDLSTLDLSSTEDSEPEILEPIEDQAILDDNNDDEQFVDPLILTCISYPDPQDFNNKKTQTDQRPNPCTNHSIDAEAVGGEDFVAETKGKNAEEVIRIKTLIEIQADIVFNLKDTCENVDILSVPDDLQAAFQRTSTELAAICEFTHNLYGDIYREVDQLNTDDQHPERIVSTSGKLEAFRTQFDNVNKLLKETFGANQLFWETFKDVGYYLEDSGFWGLQHHTTFINDPLDFLEPEVDQFLAPKVDKA